MSISYLEVPHFDHIFKRTISPVVVNDIPYVTVEEREAFNALILTTYESDVLSNVPTCACGDTQNGFNLGKICSSCGTPVTYPSEGEIELRTWIRVPPGIDGFMTPVIWAQLTNILNAKGYNILEWLSNAKSRPPRQITRVTQKRIDYFNSIGWERGMNAFIRQFDQFLDLLPQLSKKKGVRFAAYLRTVRDRIFPKHLPLPTKAMLILENTQVGSFADKASITGAIDAARTIAHIEAPRVKPLTYAQIEKETISVITNLVEYYTATIKNTFCSKKGWFRGQLFCSRSHFCLRGVITSITEPHYHEELHIPWAQGLEIFKIHIVSKLLRRNWSWIDAHALVENNGNTYNEIIDGVIEELISEGPAMEIVSKYTMEMTRHILLSNKINAMHLSEAAREQLYNEWYEKLPTSGIPCIFQRNPSLHRLSGQCFYITRVKKDVSDKTISISVLNTRGPNCDFDGDEMNLFLLMDQDIYASGKMLRSHYGIHDLTHLGELSNVISLPDVTTSIIANFIESED